MNFPSTFWRCVWCHFHYNFHLVGKFPVEIVLFSLVLKVDIKMLLLAFKLNFNARIVRRKKNIYIEIAVKLNIYQFPPKSVALDWNTLRKIPILLPDFCNFWRRIYFLITLPQRILGKHWKPHFSSFFALLQPIIFNEIQ